MDRNKENPAHKYISSHRKLLGPLIIFGKRALRKSLKWYLNPITEQQSIFNNASTDALQSLYKITNELANSIERTNEINSINNEKLANIDLKIEENINLFDDSNNQLIEKYNQLNESNNQIRESYNLLMESHKLVLNKVELIEEKYNNLLSHTGYSASNNDTFFEKKTYGQSGEDSILAYIIHVMGIPFDKVTYIDLGANHAKEMNNTYYFYSRGAKGVLVEANSKLIPELRLYRNRDTILNNIVDVVDNEEVMFYILNGDGLSTPDLESANKFCEINPNLEIVANERIKTITYNTIVKEHLKCAPTILSIDIEGKDLEILNTIDYVNYRPFLIVVEMIEYDTDLNYKTKNKEILNQLNSNGYDEYAFTGINSIFIDRKRLEV